MAMPTEAAYSIADLARLTGVNVRTIRYYIAQGLIPSSGESGPGAHYGEGHLGRLRLTKRLQAQHLPLSEIRARLSALTDDDVAGLVDTAREEAEAPPTSALEYVRQLLGADTARAAEATAGTGHTPAQPSALSPPVAPPRSALRAGLLGTAAKRLGHVEVSEQKEPLSLAESTEDFATQAAPGAGAPPAMPPLKDVPARPPRATERPANEPKSLARSQWERLSLGPNVELHIRRPSSRLEQRRVERLITIARQVLNEDQS